MDEQDIMRDLSLVGNHISTEVKTFEEEEAEEIVP
jgi:hypothetical protein